MDLRNSRANTQLLGKSELFSSGKGRGFDVGFQEVRTEIAA